MFNTCSTGNGISPQYKSGQNPGYGFLYGTNVAFHNHNSVPQKYAHESLYHTADHGTVTYYNDQMTANTSNQNASFTSLPIGYHVPLYSQSNGTPHFQFPEHEISANRTTTSMSPTIVHKDENQSGRSGLGLLVDSATSNTSGRDVGKGQRANGTSFYSVPFDVPAGTQCLYGSHGITSRSTATSDMGTFSVFADSSEYVPGNRLHSIEQSNNASNINGCVRAKEPELFWRYGPISPIDHGDTVGQPVPSTMVPLMSPTTSMYHQYPNQVVQCTKLHPQASRSHHAYFEAPRQPNGSHPSLLQDHYDCTLKTVPQAKDSQGLCAMCGLSQARFFVEPCGHLYHTQCVASLRKKAQKRCFCGQVRNFSISLKLIH